VWIFEQKIKTYLAKMKEKQLAEFTDQELLEEAKKDKLSPIVTALFIGFLAGIAMVGVGASFWGFTSPDVNTSVFNATGFIAAIIPLYFIYRMLKGSKRNEEVEKLLQERGLK
jgi:hypothetical protein